MDVIKLLLENKADVTCEDEERDGDGIVTVPLNCLVFAIKKKQR